MSRKMKNIIMIGIAILLSVSIVGTCLYIKNNTTNNVPVISEERKDMGFNHQRNNRENNMVKGKRFGDANTENVDNNMNAMERPEMPNEGFKKRLDFNQSNNNIDSKYYILIGGESLCLSLVILYLLLSNFNKKGFKETFKDSDKVLIFSLASLLLTGVLTFTSTTITKNSLTNNTNVINKMENNSGKETTAEDVSEGQIVNSKTIDLSKYTSNVTITEAGEYTLTGNLTNSVIVNSTAKVTLNLNNVTINASTTAAIANATTNELVINLVDGTTNTLTDGGSSEYDGCIFSYGPLTINGDGTLYVYGHQDDGEGIATKSANMTINGGNIFVESNDDGLNAGGDGGTITINGGVVVVKASGDGVDSNKDFVVNGGTVYTMGSSLGGDAGIDTDAGYVINGGTVIALGSDMLETPNNNTKQNTIAITLSSQISKDTLITLLDNNDNVVISFKAQENFKTLIISSDKITNGNYKLYTGGSNTGKLVNNIYTNNNYTKGTLLKEITVSSKVTNVK